MGQTDDLKALFLVDQQLRGLERRLDGARNHVNAQQHKLDTLNQQHHDLQDQLRHARAAEANLESEVGGLDDHVNKLREQMNTVKTNKEYSALLVEVNTFKIDKAKKEEQALELLQQIEQLQGQVEDIKQRIIEVEKIKGMADETLQTRQDEIRDQLEQLRGEREHAAEKIPPSTLAEFERLADALDGEAMAEVHQDDARRMEYSCGGCFMSIPPESVSQLVTGDELIRCTSCRRILYLQPELRQAIGSH